MRDNMLIHKSWLSAHRAWTHLSCLIKIEQFKNINIRVIVNIVLYKMKIREKKKKEKRSVSFQSKIYLRHPTFLEYPSVFQLFQKQDSSFWLGLLYWDCHSQSNLDDDDVSRRRRPNHLWSSCESFERWHSCKAVFCVGTTTKDPLWPTFLARNE